MRILIIDDDEVDRKAIRRALRASASPPEIYEAPDTRSGLSLLQKESFDCILLDYRLPDSDGLTFAQELKNHSNSATTPIIMLTGEGDETIAVEALKIGIQDYMPKALITTEGLVRAISTAVDLVNARNQIAELNAQKDKFFSIIAHDLKNPFNTVLGFSQLIAEFAESYDKKQLVDLGRKIHQSSLQVHDLLENLLEWSLLQRNQVNCELSCFNINEQITNNLLLLKEVAAAKDIELNHQYVTSLDVHADKHMTDAVLRNLIGNAIKFTQARGNVSISANEKGNRIEVNVTDTGTGMSPEKLERLFLLGEHTSTEGTNGETGTGLGLNLCKEYVEKQGGELIVESVLGKGSSFQFTLSKPDAPQK